MAEYKFVLVRGLDDISVHSGPQNYKVTKSFTLGELACPLARRAKVGVDFLSALQDLRDEVDHSMKINSCCRSTQHNTNVGGHPRSLHLMDNPYHPTLGTIAADISTTGWDKLKHDRFIMMAYKAGFSVGVADSFIHIDARGLIDLPQTNWRY